MKYLIVILAVCTALNAFGAGRVNPFNGQPLTYSLSEMETREAMGALAYDTMRRDQWAGTWVSPEIAEYNEMAQIFEARHDEFNAIAESYSFELPTLAGREAFRELPMQLQWFYDLIVDPEKTISETATGERRAPSARFNGPQHNIQYMNENEASWGSREGKADDDANTVNNGAGNGMRGGWTALGNWIGL